MKEGDRIRVFLRYGDTEDFTVEMFRHCLGIFLSKQHREAGVFKPLCDLYEPGSESESKYISNFGAYNSNLVPTWMDIP